MNKIVLRTSTLGTRYVLDSYQLEYPHFTVDNPPAPRSQLTTPVTMILETGEYISSVTITIDGYLASPPVSSSSWVAVMRIETSHPSKPSRSLVSTGTASTIETVRTFSAPKGWKVVGFRGNGYAKDNTPVSRGTLYSIIGLAPIIAPI